MRKTGTGFDRVLVFAHISSGYARNAPKCLWYQWGRWENATPILVKDFKILLVL